MSYFRSNVAKKILLLLVILPGVVGVLWSDYQSDAATGIAKVINYQGRLADSNGTAVTNGSYNMAFVLYDASTSGNCKWSAKGTGTNGCTSPSTTMAVTVTNGDFSVLLGDTTSGGGSQNAIPDEIFDNDTLYLQIHVSGETLTPRRRIGAAGYAYNTDRLDGLETSSTGGTSAVVPVTSSSGNFVLTGAPAGSGVSQGVVYVNPATANYTLFGVAVGGSSKFRIDAEGDATIGGTLNGLTLPSSGTLVTLAGVETLTNKTLTSPILTAPVLGIATATSLNGLTISASTGTLTITDGKTLSVTDNATVSGTNTGDQTTVSGNAGSATTAAITDDTATNATVYPTWVTTTSGNLPQKISSTKLSFNPSTGLLTSTGFSGPLTGNVTGNASTVTGLSVASGKTLTASNTITFTADDGATLVIGSGGTLGSGAYATIGNYAPVSNPTFTGTVTIPTPFTLGATPVTTTGTQLNYLASVTGTTGTTNTSIVFSTSPTLVTPTLGVASATSINKVVITAPVTSATLTIADGKTLTSSNTLTLAGTDSTTITFQGTDTYVGRTTTDTLTNKTLTTPVIASISNSGTITIPTGTDTLVGRATTDTLTNKTLTSPDINGGTADALTSLGIRSTGTGAFDLTFANTENLTAGRTLTIKMNDAARTIDLGGNLATAGALITSGANSLTLTTTGATNVTLPTTGTLATLDGSETLTNKTLTSPTLTTPALGVASATSINKVAITAPATGSTLTVAEGKTLTTSNTITFTATDGSTLAIGNGGTLGTGAYATIASYAPLASPTFTGTVTIPTPFTLGATPVTSTGTQLNYLASAGGTTGTTSTNLVFSTSPTLVTPTLGAASATSINKVAITAPTTSATLTLADGSTLTTSGANTLTLTTTGSTNVTLPTTGTLATLAGAEELSNKTITTSSGAFTTLSSTGVTALGNNSATVAINSSDWDIDATGAMTGIGAITSDGAISTSSTFNADSTVTLGGTTIDANANFALASGTGTFVQTYTGDTTDAAQITASSITTADALQITASGLTTGNALNIISTSTAGGASGVSYMAKLARSGANSNTAHTAYGVYSTVTNTNATSGTNVAGYFSASGATTANYGLIVENGSVGIGMTAPDKKLSVAGSGTVAIFGQDISAGQTAGIVIGQEDASDKSGNIYYDLDNNYMALQIGGDAVGTALTIANGGNIGIGTTSPSVKLDVSGSGKFTGGTNVSTLTGSIDPAASATVPGVGTAFTTELVVGDRITVSGETRTVTAIASDTSLTVDQAFTDNANDASPDKLIPLLGLSYTNTVGTIANISVPAGTSQGSGTITGVTVDLKNNLTPASNQLVQGYSVMLPTINNNSSGNVGAFNGFFLGSNGVGAVTNSGTGTFSWRGANIVMPAITQSSSGVLTADGYRVMMPPTSAITTAGVMNGVSIIGPAGVGASVGTLNGISIASIQAGNATETALNIGSGWDTGISLASSFSQTFAGTTTDAFNIAANSLTSGNALDISSASTAATDGTALATFASSGANATNAVTRYGVYSTVTNTNATSGTNVAGYFSASGATTANYGLIVNAGSVGIGDTSPAALLTVGSGDVFQVASTGLTTINRSNILTTPTDGIIITNTTASPNGGSQYSPSIVLHGSSWLDPGAGENSYPMEWRILNANDPGGGSRIQFDFDWTGAGFNTQMSLGGDGTLNINSLIAASSITGTFATANTERLCWDGSGASAITDCTGTPGDYAEQYGTSDASIEAGDIVVIDSTRSAEEVTDDRGDKGSKAWMIKSSATYQATILGVISTHANEVIGQNFVTEDNARPVVLTGRIPVKVNLDGGDIVVGDRITTSSVAGVGMKAKQSGWTIGVALESYNTQSLDNKIIVWFNPQYVLLENVDGNIGIGTDDAQYKFHVQGDVAATSFVNISTRAAKKDIEYLTAEDNRSILAKLSNIHVARYHYNEESATTPLHLGLIAEEAPLEVLSVSGKGVDIYKLASFTLAAVKAQQSEIGTIKTKLDMLDEKLSAIGNGGSGASSTDLELLRTQMNLLQIQIEDLSKAQVPERNTSTTVSAPVQSVADEPSAPVDQPDQPEVSVDPEPISIPEPIEIIEAE